MSMQALSASLSLRHTSSLRSAHDMKCGQSPGRLLELSAVLSMPAVECFSHTVPLLCVCNEKSASRGGNILLLSRN